MAIQWDKPKTGISWGTVEVKPTVADTIWSQLAKKVGSEATGFALGAGGIGLTAVDYLGKKAVNAFGSEQAKQNIENAPSLQEQFREKFNTGGAGEVVGQVSSLAAPVSTIGKGTELAAKGMGLGKTASTLARAGAEGAAFTAGVGLQEGKKQTLEDYAINTGLNIAFPLAGMATKKVGENLPGRIVNSLIKPLQKDFAYGKNPGKTVAELVKPANDFDELINNIRETRNTIGQNIGQVTSNSPSLQKIQLSSSLKPIDEAIASANKAPLTNKSIIDRLEDVKSDLSTNIQKGINPVDYKALIGDLTKWTGAASDDKVVNKTLKQVYGSTRELMDNALQKDLTPEQFNSYKKSAEDYGNLISAENAAKHRDQITQRNDLISFGAKNSALIAALSTAVSTGGLGLGTALAGIGGAVIDKAMATPAFKTRLAFLISKLAPKDVSTFFEKVPTAKQLFTDEQINKFVSEPKLGLSTKKEIPTPETVAKDLSNNPDVLSLMKDFAEKGNRSPEIDDILKSAGLAKEDASVKFRFAEEVMNEHKALQQANEQSSIAEALKGKTPEEMAKMIQEGTLTKENLLKTGEKALNPKGMTQEEWVKAHGDPVYHGSDKADVIEKEGFKKSPNATGVNAFGEGTYLATNKTDAKGYGGIVKSFIPKDLKLKKVSSSEAYTIKTKKLIEEGYDGVEVTTGNGKNITIFAPKNIKTRSQLIDEWKKANNK